MWPIGVAQNISISARLVLSLSTKIVYSTKGREPIYISAGTWQCTHNNKRGNQLQLSNLLSLWSVSHVYVLFCHSCSLTLLRSPSGPEHCFFDWYLVFVDIVPTGNLKSWLYCPNSIYLVILSEFYIFSYIVRILYI